MKSSFYNLNKSVIFKNLSINEINDILISTPYLIKSFAKDDIIAIEEDPCSSLGIILKGSIEIHKSFPSGKLVTINHFVEGNIFGEALVFSKEHKYPATIISSEDSEIMYISKDDIIKMMSLNPHILNNFVGVLSNRILMLNERITNLSYDSLRKKIANILLLEYAKQKSLNILLPYSRKKMAQLLNITRPSLSRELVNMKEDGLIDFHKNKIKILSLKELEKILL